MSLEVVKAIYSFAINSPTVKSVFCAIFAVKFHVNGNAFIRRPETVELGSFSHTFSFSDFFH